MVSRNAKFYAALAGRFTLAGVGALRAALLGPGILCISTAAALGVLAVPRV